MTVPRGTDDCAEGQLPEAGGQYLRGRARYPRGVKST